MKKKRSLSTAQIQAREERKERFAGIARRLAAMSDDERAELAAKLPIVMTCEGHPLSMRNTLLLAFQNAEPCSIVGGFRQWIKQGRCVRKGQHGSTILFPCGGGRSMTPADFRTLIERQLMPYDYARERDDVRNADMGDDDEVTAFDLRDEDDAPPDLSPFRCVRGDCGALDCSRCFPGGCHDEQPDEE